MNLYRQLFAAIDHAPRPVKKAVLSGWSGLRSLLYTAEAQPLRAIDALVRLDPSIFTGPPMGYQKNIIHAARTLLDQDVENIVNGIYPASVLAAEESAWHGIRYLQVLLDATMLSQRKKRQEHQNFSAPARDFLEDTPEYYQRNFHFQTDGYLSRHSAELYDHQVEILFQGTASAMRRLLLPPLREHLGTTRGQGVKIIDLGCGTGQSSRLLAEMYPLAQVTCLDLSAPYLHQARRTLDAYDRCDFVQADAAQTPFMEHTFDVVCSTFLFHELPMVERERVIAEGRRILKPGGMWLMVDSIQSEDAPEFAWSLEQFPRHFHEPFYKNYILHPMEEIVRKVGLTKTQSHCGFFSKVVSAIQPEENPVERNAARKFAKNL